MNEMILVELPQGDMVVVRVPKGVSASDFRDYVEAELNMDTRGEITTMTLAQLRQKARDAR
jgi:hypothetical protein